MNDGAVGVKPAALSLPEMDPVRQPMGKGARTGLESLTTRRVDGKNSLSQRQPRTQMACAARVAERPPPAEAEPLYPPPSLT